MARSNLDKTVSGMEETGTDVATTAPGAMPAFMQGKTMTGAGVSTKAEDIMIPMARILQSNSPEVQNGNAKRIPGAESGDIYIRNAPVPLIKAAKGFLFQPCHFTTAVVEWKPRASGGGIVKKHVGMPADAVERPNPERPEKMMIVSSKTGNVYVDTRYHAGYAISRDNSTPPMPLYIPLSSSGHSISKAWMLAMSLKRMNGQLVDCFAIYWDFLTKLQTGGGYTWPVFDIKDAGPKDANGNPTTMWVPTEEDYLRGKQLFDALEAGEMAFEESERPDEAVGNSNRGAADVDAPF
jgi:hypothetical protein